MTTHTLIAASPRPAPELDLDTRLTLLNIEMDARLRRAGITFDVNTAYIGGVQLPEIPEITALPRLTPTAAPRPHDYDYDTPLAALLHRAKVYIENHGLNRGHLRDENGPAYGAARCPIGAIQIEADSRRQADDACVLLDQAILADFPDATIPSWVDAQTSPAPVLLYLGRAAELADSRGL